MSVSGIKNKTRRSKIKIAFIADDIRTINEFELNHNATFGLMLASHDLGAQTFLTESNNLKIVNGNVFAKFDEVIVKSSLYEHLKVKNTKEFNLNDFSVIFARKDPPVNQNYISYVQTLLLVSKNKTVLINDPVGILKANEKLYALNFPDYTPPTLVSFKKDEILQFLKTHNEAVIKPIFNNGGEGVFYLKANDKKSILIIEKSLKSESNVLLVQKYIPDIVSGDKRIILLNGEIIGSVFRVPKPGELRANFHRGASPKCYTPTKRDIEICTALKPYLQRDGLYFTSIDIIGDYLIEINVTCPAGLVEAEKSMNKPLTRQIVEWAIKRQMQNTKL